MKTVFISSVVGGMESFRKAAKQAITTMEYKPIMCEDFSAKPYSSEIACLLKVEQSDIYVVIIGKDYGYTTPDNISATQAEFRAAQAANKHILAFVQEIDSRDTEQMMFLNEVEDYKSGVFRENFSSKIELNNKIIAALRSLETKNQAISDDDFKIRVKNVLDKRQRNQNKPEMIMAFLPQPEREVDIISIESDLDEKFQLLCRANITRICDGYKTVNNAHWTGFSSDPYSVFFYEDGLVLLICDDPTLSDKKTSFDHFFDHFFILPDKIANTAKGFRQLISERSGFVYMALNHMENTYVADPPHGNSMVQRTSGDNSAEYSSLFSPLIDAAYNSWVDQCVSKLKRTFRYDGEK